MPERLFATWFTAVRVIINMRIAILVLGAALSCGLAQVPDPLTQAVITHAYPLPGAGQQFLLGEAANADFFMLGELHGDNDVPELVASLWPAMWHAGYRHVAAEVSPWAAAQLETAAGKPGPDMGLWTLRQASVVLAPAGHNGVIWGCDIEEIRPQALIHELAQLNPGYARVRQMTALTAAGYQRSAAPRLQQLLARAATGRDAAPGGISLRESLTSTLRVESERLDRAHLLIAQQDREDVMKRQFIEHYQAGAPGKVLLRFGQSHLFRAHDAARGVSTLGNFVAEIGIERKPGVFNVAVFGAGGQYRMNGATASADQTTDERGLAWLARRATGPATVFDVRPLRVLLRAIPEEQRTSEQRNLIEWTDGYDALICLKQVTPLDAVH